MATLDITMERGLPAHVNAEQLVLGAILLDDSAFVSVAGALESDDFSLQKHRRIFGAMMSLNEVGERIDRVTVANELMKRGQLESVDGLGYLVSLDDGLPQIFNLDSYVRIVKDKSMLRRIIFELAKDDRPLPAGQEDPSDILGDAEETLLKLGEAGERQALLNPGQIIEQYEGGINAFLDPSRA